MGHRKSLRMVAALLAAPLVAAACSTGDDGESSNRSVAPSIAEDGASEIAGPVSTACGPTEWSYPADLYPFQGRCMDLGFGDYHFIDEQTSDSPVGTVLMVHGNPTSSFLYREVAKHLLDADYRVVAMDHYGFGLSAKPPLDAFGHQPSDHADVLVDFVDALDLTDVTLLVQDWGGPIGLAMATTRPDAVGSLLIMNTWAWSVDESDVTGPYHRLVTWSLTNHEREAQFAETGVIITGAVRRLSMPYQEPGATQVRAGYLGPFFDPATGALRTATSAQPTVELALAILDDEAVFEHIGDLESLTDKPLYLYFGGADRLFGALIPAADGSCATGTAERVEGRLVCVDGRGDLAYPYVDRFASLWDADAIRGIEIDDTADHFVQEQAPERVAEIVALLSE